MGELVFLAERRAAHQAAAEAAAVAAARKLPERVFYFDFSSPFSYLDGDRIERVLGGAQWRPAPSVPSGMDVCSMGSEIFSAGLQREAEHRAAALRLPLSWPEDDAADCTGLHRAAAYAADVGRGPRFAMAALRLAYCGGFDLSDELLLEEAAAAAGLTLEACRDAAVDTRWDGDLAANRAELSAAGLGPAPAIRVGYEWFVGERAVVDAGLAMTAPMRRPA